VADAEPAVADATEAVRQELDTGTHEASRCLAFAAFTSTATAPQSPTPHAGRALKPMTPQRPGKEATTSD
jgi:hypothetical protein